MRVKTTPECKYVQLVQLCNFLQELLAVWAQPCVEHRLSSPELEMKNTLRKTKNKHVNSNDQVNKRAFVKRLECVCETTQQRMWLHANDSMHFSHGWVTLADSTLIQYRGIKVNSCSL